MKENIENTNQPNEVDNLDENVVENKSTEVESKTVEKNVVENESTEVESKAVEETVVTTNPNIKDYLTYCSKTIF